MRVKESQPTIQVILDNLCAFKVVLSERSNLDGGGTLRKVSIPAEPISFDRSVSAAFRPNKTTKQNNNLLFLITLMAFPSSAIPLDSVGCSLSMSHRACSRFSCISHCTSRFQPLCGGWNPAYITLWILLWIAYA